MHYYYAQNRLLGIGWVDMLPNLLSSVYFIFEPDSLEYAEMVGPLSPYGGRVTHPLGFVDAWEMTDDNDTGYTSDVRGVPARLDYAFVSTSLCNRIRSCWVDHHADGSDHQPLWLELC